MSIGSPSTITRASTFSASVTPRSATRVPARVGELKAARLFTAAVVAPPAPSHCAGFGGGALVATSMSR